MISVYDKNEFGVAILKGVKPGQRILVKCSTKEETDAACTTANMFSLRNKEILNNNNISRMKPERAGIDVLITAIPL